MFVLIFKIVLLSYQKIWEELEQEALIEEMFEKELERDEFIYFQHQQQQQQSFPEFNLQMQEGLLILQSYF